MQEPAKKQKKLRASETQYNPKKNVPPSIVNQSHPTKRDKNNKNNNGKYIVGYDACTQYKAATAIAEKMLK